MGSALFISGIERVQRKAGLTIVSTPFVSGYAKLPSGAPHDIAKRGFSKEPS
jgi:hypothetical protein